MADTTSLQPYADEVMQWLREGKEFVAEQAPKVYVLEQIARLGRGG
jgi:hypothetical protein